MAAIASAFQLLVLMRNTRDFDERFLLCCIHASISYLTQAQVVTACEKFGLLQPDAKLANSG
jgi:hypothetical protein